jgi:hypothetical protein
MTILRQIKDLKTEFASIHSHVLRRFVQINGGVPLALDPKKPLRRTLLPGFLVIGGLPHTPSQAAFQAEAYVPDQDKPEQDYRMPEQFTEDVIA